MAEPLNANGDYRDWSPGWEPTTALPELGVVVRDDTLSRKRTVISRLRRAADDPNSHYGEVGLPSAEHLRGPYLAQLAHTHPELLPEATQLVAVVTAENAEQTA